MALNGIGGGEGGSALERFQALRDSAKKKLDGTESQTNLAELIKRKQAEINNGGAVAARTSAERIPPKPAAPAATGNPYSAGDGLLGAAYGRTGGVQKQDPKPTLGRHVDFMA